MATSGGARTLAGLDVHPLVFLLGVNLLLLLLGRLGFLLLLVLAAGLLVVTQQPGQMLDDDEALLMSTFAGQAVLAGERLAIVDAEDVAVELETVARVVHQRLERPPLVVVISVPLPTRSIQAVNRKIILP